MYQLTRKVSIVFFYIKTEKCWILKTISKVCDLIRFPINH